MQNPLPITPDVLHNELETARAILDKWTQIVNNGLPGIDTPAPQEALDQLIWQMRGELQIVSGRCDTLVEVLGTPWS